MRTYWKAIQNNEKQSTKNDARFARIYILRLFGVYTKCKSDYEEDILRKTSKSLFGSGIIHTKEECK